MIAPSTTYIPVRTAVFALLNAALLKTKTLSPYDRQDTSLMASVQRGMDEEGQTRALTPDVAYVIAYIVNRPVWRDPDQTYTLPAARLWDLACECHGLWYHCSDGEHRAWAIPCIKGTWRFCSRACLETWASPDWLRNDRDVPDGAERLDPDQCWEESWAHQTCDQCHLPLLMLDIRPVGDAWSIVHTPESLEMCKCACFEDARLLRSWLLYTGANWRYGFAGADGRDERVQIALRASLSVLNRAIEHSLLADDMWFGQKISALVKDMSVDQESEAVHDR